MSDSLHPDAEQWLQSHRRRIFAPWVRPADVLLEFGPRDAWNLRAIAASRKYACWPRVDRALLEKENISILGSAPEIPDALADVVICYNVLEYQLEPREIILDLKRALKPNGTISIHALYDPDFRRPRLDRVAEHYFSWNVQTLGNLLIDSGFTFVRGGVYRYPREESVLQKRGGHKWAALASKIFDPFEQVHVVARKSAV
jgi:SAM-dependent methyltransferase